MTPDDFQPCRLSTYRHRLLGITGRIMRYNKNTTPNVRVWTSGGAWEGNYVDFWEEWIHADLYDRLAI